MDKVFHAYIDEHGKRYSLVQHSIDTLMVVLKTSINRRLETIINRLTRQPSYKGLIHSYLLISFLFHDIGKIMVLYQVRPRGWRHGYQFHELVSGIVLYKILDELLFDDIGDVDYRVIMYLIVESVKRHHYAMLRDPQVFVDKFNEYFVDYMRGEYNIVRKVDLETYMLQLKKCSDFYNNIIPRELKGIVEEISNDIIQGLNDIVFTTSSVNWLEERLSKIENELIDKGVEEINIYNTVLTGLLSLADYTAASIERGDGLKGYVSRIYSLREIIELRNSIPINCPY